eukprot:CAMPEP_0184866982 /NCGR_PEP_ID=MMETSP0580-20130426/24569_1 /TAXON_ID=1118495 /ORGANISM="Dactyliosolen fragilissimus" /LENGTH=1085 /DNA_ID=CAMNT_0027366963 /DNA_START=32 /DNA_END=3289 /DNA_ORIENTATION=-
MNDTNDDSILGLNLVVLERNENIGNIDRKAIGQDNKKRHRKKNKYEKRRAAARRAKDESNSKKEAVSSPVASKIGGTVNVAETTCSTNDEQRSGDDRKELNPIVMTCTQSSMCEKETKTKAVVSEVIDKPRPSPIPDSWKHALQTMIKQEDPLDRHTRDPPDGGNTITMPTESKSSSSPECKIDALPVESSKEEIMMTGNVKATEMVASSRKTQHKITTQTLQDDERRAEYMSTYHARPREMDRRSGAVSVIKASRYSSHIFGSDNEDEDNTDNIDISSNVNGKNTEHGAGKEDKNQHSHASNYSLNNDHKTKCPFTACGLHPRLVKAITDSKGSEMNLKKPTIIQKDAWSKIIPKTDGFKENAPKNIFIQSETGSGKTLAYLLPLLQNLGIDELTNEIKRVDRATGGTRAIILCPTRELATQTFSVAEKICRASFPWLVPGCFSGGEKRKSEKARLRKGITILIATPGRLLDHLDKTDCLLMSLKGKLEWVVLDESDRLLDMGLGSQVERIVQTVRANQPKSGTRRDGITWRSALVSATVSDEVQDLAKKLLGVGGGWVWAMGIIDSNIIKSNSCEQQNHQEKNIEKSSIVESNSKTTSSAGFELSSATPRQLTQLFMIVSAKLRLPALIAFLAARVKRGERVVVFMSTCDGVDFHHKLLSSTNPIMNLNNKQKRRGKNIDEFEDNDENDTNSKGIFGDSCDIYKLHGNIPHNQRQEILSSFNSITSIGYKTDEQSKSAILMATDVAARGLNLTSVDWIIQYDPPCETSDYVHRAGRAARAGKGGHALLFLLPSEKQYVEVLGLRGLKEMTALSLSSTLQAAASICRNLTVEGVKRSGGGNIGGDRDGEAFTTEVQLRLEDCIIQDDKDYKDALALKVASSSDDKNQKRRDRKRAKNAVGPLLASARNAYAAYIRAYPAKEKAVRHIFSQRALHLGHIARSHALKDPPKVLAKANRNARPGIDNSFKDESILSSTGRKRSHRLSFGKELKDDHDQGEIHNSETDNMLEQTNSFRKKQKKNRNISLREVTDNVDSNLRSNVSFVNHNGENEKFSNHGGNPSSYGVIQQKMLAAAAQIEGNGLEYF